MAQSVLDIKANEIIDYRERISKRRGRPTSFGPFIARKIYKALMKGNSFQNAARLAGISLPTINAWTNDGLKHRKECKLDSQTCYATHEREAAFAAFSIKIEIAIGIFAQRTVGNITNMARTELRANTFLLERRFPQEWGAVQEINVTSHSVIEHLELNNLDSKQRLQMSDALRRRALLQSGDEVLDAEIITPQDSSVSSEES